MTDGTFESGVADWTATSCALAQDATQHHSGADSGKITVSGTPARAVIRPATPPAATPNTMHTLSMWVYSTSAVSNVRASIDWIDGDGAAISTSETDDQTIPAATWTQVTLSAIAPSDAATWTFGPTLTSPSSGQVLWVDDVEAATVTVTAVQDSAWPPRVLVTVTGFLPGVSLVVFRHHADGGIVRLRGGTFDPTSDTAAVTLDGEYPFGESIFYAAQVDGTEVAWSDDATWSLPGGKVALSDPLTGLSCEAVITAWPQISNDRGGSVFQAGAHVIAVTPPRAPGGESEIEFLTETETSRQQMIALLSGCTGGMILIRQPGTYAGVDGVYAVLSDVEARAAQSGMLERRLWTLRVVQVEAWTPLLFTAGWQLADIADAYEDNTLAEVGADFDTLLDIAVYDWGLA